MGHAPTGDAAAARFLCPAGSRRASDWPGRAVRLSAVGVISLLPASCWLLFSGVSLSPAWRVAAHGIWVLAALGAVVLCMAPPQESRRRAGVCWAAGVFLLCYGARTLPGWSAYGLGHDSEGYLQPYRFSRPWEHLRLPGYPLFIGMVTCGRAPSLLPGEGEAASAPRPPHGGMVPDPLLRVVRFQRLLLLAAFCGFLTFLYAQFSCPALLLMATPPVVDRCVPPEVTLVLSEALALTLLLAAAGLTIRYGATRRVSTWLLALAAAGMAFWVRPALLPAVGLVLLTLGFCHWRQPATALRRAMLGLPVLALIALPCLTLFLQSGVVTLTPAGSLYPICTALHLATVADRDRVPAGASRRMFEQMLERKAVCDAAAAERFPDWTPAERYAMSGVSDDYIFRVAVPVLREAIAAGIAPSGGPFWLTAQREFPRISAPVIRAHRREFAATVLENLRIASGHNPRLTATRLARVFPLSAWLVLILASSPFLAWHPRLAVGWLLLLHLVNVLFVACTHVPCPRLVWFTEFAVLTAAALGWGLALPVLRVSLRRWGRRSLERCQAALRPRLAV